jgi:hypothetical protein
MKLKTTFKKRIAAAALGVAALMTGCGSSQTSPVGANGQPLFPGSGGIAAYNGCVPLNQPIYFSAGGAIQPLLPSSFGFVSNVASLQGGAASYNYQSVSNIGGGDSMALNVPVNPLQNVGSIPVQVAGRLTIGSMTAQDIALATGAYYSGMAPCVAGIDRIQVSTTTGNQLRGIVVSLRVSSGAGYISYQYSF